MILSGLGTAVFSHNEKNIPQKKKKTRKQGFVALPLILVMLLVFAVPAYPDTKPGPYVSTDQTTTVKATGGDSIEVDNITVTTNANGSHGLYADGGSISGTADVITNRRNSHAVYADNEGTITLTGKIETKGGTSKYPSHGIYANNGSSVVFSGDIIVSGDPSSYGAFADNGSKITLSGSVTTTNTAVQVNGGSKANITSGTKIKTAGSSKVQNGVDANGAGTEAHIGNNVLFDIKTQGLVAANNAKIYASDDIVIKGGNGGIVATSGGQVNVGDGLSVDATHTSVSATYNGKVYIGDNAKISSEHDRGLSVSDGTGSEIHVGNGLHITANASLEGRAISAIGGGKIYISDDATAVVRDGWGIFLDGAESEIRIGDRLTLETAEKSSENKRPAVYVIAGKLFIGDSATINSDNAFGIYSVRGGQVDIGKGLSLDAKHYAIYALNGGTINVGSDARVSADIHAFVASKSGSEIFIGENTEVTAGTLALHALQKGRIQAQDGLSVTVTDAGGIAIAAGEGGVVELGGAKIYAPNKEGFALQAQNNDETGSTTKITGTGLYDIVGRLYAVGDAEINLTMQSGSQLKGASYLSGDALEGNRGTIALKMDNTKWELTDDSELTSLTLGGGSQVDFSSLPLGSILSVGTLAASDTASGVFKMKTDVVNGQGDQLNVTDTSNGSFKILVQNDGAQTTTGKETVTLAQTADNGATFTLANAGETVSLGAYSYILDNFGAGGTGEWRLYSTGKVTPAADAAVNTFMGGYLLAYAETQTLMQRLGDLRDAPYLSGFWFRVYGGKMESNSRSFVRGFDMNYGGVQVGYDRKIESKWKGDVYVGGYFGYSKGDLDYNVLANGTGGSGKVDSKSAGVYATYIQDDGFYADALVKYMWMKNEFGVLDTDGDRVTGEDLSTGGLGLSLELGKRFRFNQNDKGGNWYVEPQVQYSYTHQDGGHYYASNGLRIGVDSFTSSLGRVGMLVGYETGKTNFYAKASYVKEFDGDVNIVANNVGIPETFEDSWWVYGLGFTSKVNERNSVYMSLERAEGGKFTEPWKVYAGWRITF